MKPAQPKAAKAKGKKGNDGGGDLFKQEDILQGVILADSYAVKFRPITHEKPKALLPLVNVPMIEYALELLAANAVKQIFVVCSSHASVVEEYLHRSKWKRGLQATSVECVRAEDAGTVGDALRHLESLNVIRGDFILMGADVVSNIKLAAALQAHKDRVKKDKHNVMTMVMMKAAPSHRSRILDDSTVVALDKETNELMFYENSDDTHEVNVSLNLFNEHARVRLRYDLMDCGIDICTTEVLTLFKEEFDYQDLRRDFVKGLLGSDVYGHKLHAHVTQNEYAARVADLHTYDSVSKDIVQRWTFPVVPDNNWSGSTFYTFQRGNIYKEHPADKRDEVQLTRTCQLGTGVVIGSGTSIGDRSTLDHTIVGRNCKIGNNVRISNSYLWGDNIIEDGVTLDHVILCNGAVVRQGCTVPRGCVLSFRTDTADESDGDVSDRDQDAAFGSDGSDASEHSAGANSPRANQPPIIASDPSAVGEGGVGRRYATASADPFHLNSIAPDMAAWRQKLQQDEIKGDDTLHDFDEDLDDGADGAGSDEEAEEDGLAHATAAAMSGAAGPAGAGAARRLPDAKFMRELRETLRRGQEEGLDVDSIQLEISSLKLSHDATALEYFTAVFKALLSLIKSLSASAAPGPAGAGASAAGGAVKITKAISKEASTLLIKWKSLLKKFGQAESDQTLIIFGLQAACLEFEAYRPLFPILLRQLYDEDCDIVTEDAIFAWEGSVRAELSGGAGAAAAAAAASGSTGSPDQVAALLKASEPLLQWLKEADEEDEDDD